MFNASRALLTPNSTEDDASSPNFSTSATPIPPPHDTLSDRPDGDPHARANTSHGHRKQLDESAEHDLDRSTSVAHGVPHRRAEDQSNDPNAFANHPAYRRWISEFMRALFDFSFSESVTVKMLPLLYGLAIIASAVAASYVVIESFFISPWRGILALLVIGPLFFIFSVAASRSVLEFFSVVFNIKALMHSMNAGLTRLEARMVELTGRVDIVGDQIGEMAEAFDELQKDVTSVVEVAENFEEFADRIPFLKKQKRTTRRNWAEASLSERFESIVEERIGDNYRRS